MTEDRVNEAIGLLLIAAAVLIGLSLISYSPADTGLVTSSPNLQTHNFVGVIGAYLAQALFFLIGKGAYLIPFFITIWGIFRLKGKKTEHFYLKLIGAITLLISISSILSLKGTSVQRIASGGIVGFRFSELSLTYFGMAGSYVVLITLFILSILLTTELLFFSYLLRLFKAIVNKIIELRKRRIKYSPPAKPRPVRPAVVKPAPPVAKTTPFKPVVVNKPRVEIKPAVKQTLKPVVEKAEPIPIKSAAVSRKGDYSLPSLDLLESPPPVKARKLIDDLNANARVLEETLKDFGIEVKVTEINRGPVITRYEVLPAPGVKINRIVTLSDDLALVLKAASIHIVAPIPGKSAVGIEVPNSAMTLVYLKEILQSEEWQNAAFKLTLSLGKDVAGNQVINA